MTRAGMRLNGPQSCWYFVDIGQWANSFSPLPTLVYGPLPSVCILLSTGISGFVGLTKGAGGQRPQTILFQGEAGFQGEVGFTTFLLRIYPLSPLTKNVMTSFYRIFQQPGLKINTYLELHNCLILRKFLNLLVPLFPHL